MGEYKGYHIDAVPLDYLWWFFPRIEHREYSGNETVDYWAYIDILKFFLNKRLYMKNMTRKHGGYQFFIKNHYFMSPEGRRLPFITALDRMRDSQHNYVYEFKFRDVFFYLVRINKKFYFSTKHVSQKHIYGGKRMVFERNPNYYFFDDRGLMINNAYLMRPPHVPVDSLTSGFSANFKKDI